MPTERPHCAVPASLRHSGPAPRALPAAPAQVRAGPPAGLHCQHLLLFCHALSQLRRCSDLAAGVKLQLGAHIIPSGHALHPSSARSLDLRQNKLAQPLPFEAVAARGLQSLSISCSTDWLSDIEAWEDLQVGDVWLAGGLAGWKKRAGGLWGFTLPGPPATCPSCHVYVRTAWNWASGASCDHVRG